jgi:hypothetical protein
MPWYTEIRYTSWQLLERATSIWAIYEALLNFLRHLGGELRAMMSISD